MLEQTVATWIDTNTSLTVGVDLAIGEMPDDVKEGAVVIFNRDIPSFDGYDHSLIQVILFYYDYVVGRTLAISLANLFTARKGCAGDSWAVGEEVTDDYIGLDQIDRHVFSLLVEIVYKEA